MAGEIKASPRFGLMGLFADALKGAQSGMNRVDLPYVGGLGDLMLGGAPQLADDISYQGLSALVRGGNVATGGIGTYGLKPETVDLAGVMTGLGGLARPAVNAAGRAALPVAREFVETVGARNMSGMPMARGQIGSIGVKPSSDSLDFWGFDDYFSPRSVEPPHEVRDKNKLASIARSMKTNGWEGRPILAVDMGNGPQAITGSHRISAAKEANIDVPVYLMDESILNYEDDLGRTISDALYMEPEDLIEFLEKAGFENEAELLKLEGVD